MTTQPELDLANGLATSVPTKEDHRMHFEIKSSNCVPLDGKLESVPSKAYVFQYGSGGNVSRTNRIAFSIEIDEGQPFSVLANLASRRTYFADGDERYAEMRKALVNAARLALANGMARLPEGYSFDDLNRLKGFRWSPKAGCSMCPCSPAFMSPLLAVDRYNWVNAVFKAKAPVMTVYDGGSISAIINEKIAASQAV